MGSRGILWTAVCSAILYGALVGRTHDARVQAAMMQQDQQAGKPEYYTTRVKPLIDANCGRCHEGLNHRGGLSMETRETLLKGGHHGPAVVPGDAANSLLLKLINHAGPIDDPMDMPPNKPKLTEAEIKAVEEWIRAGAVMPPPAH